MNLSKMVVTVWVCIQIITYIILDVTPTFDFTLIFNDGNQLCLISKVGYIFGFVEHGVSIEGQIKLKGKNLIEN